jgi:hypothetical protein
MIPVFMATLLLNSIVNNIFDRSVRCIGMIVALYQLAFGLIKADSIDIYKIILFLSQLDT